MFKILYVIILIYAVYKFFTISERTDQKEVSEMCFNEYYDRTRVLGFLNQPVVCGGSYRNSNKSKVNVDAKLIGRDELYAVEIPDPKRNDKSLEYMKKENERIQRENEIREWERKESERLEREQRELEWLAMTMAAIEQDEKNKAAQQENYNTSSSWFDYGDTNSSGWSHSGDNYYDDYYN